MLFPVPVKEEYGKEYYVLQELYEARDLYAFWLAVKNGNRDVCFTYDRYLKKEE